MKLMSERLITKPTAYDIIFVLAFYASLAYGLVCLSLPWIPIVLECLVSILLYFYYLLLRKTSERPPHEGRVYRKVFHMIGGGSLAVFLKLYSSALVLYLVFSLLILFCLYEALRWYILRRPLFISTVLLFFGDQEESQGGPFYEALIGLGAVLLTVLFFQKEAALCGLIALSLGDGVSGLVGERVRTSTLPFSERKTIGGFLAGVIVSSFAVLLAVGNVQALAAVLGGMLVETVSGKFDNFSVPISTALFYSALSLLLP